MFFRFFLLSIFFVSSQCLAWGSRGHSMITHLAARLLNTSQYDSKITRPFLMKEEMLGHLANIPDVSWKQLPANEVRIMSPTHYFQIDWITSEIEFSNIPRTIEAVVANNNRNCEKKQDNCIPSLSKLEVLTKIGSAPWRIQQFADKMEDALRSIEAFPLSGTDTLQVNLVLNAAGLLSHFIGDLSNPYHVVRDFDGWESGHGGMHAYFEIDLVDELDLGLIKEVYDEVMKKKPFENILLPMIPADLRKDPVSISIALAMNSAQNLKKLEQMDSKFARIKPSTQKPTKVEAERKPAIEVAHHFKQFIIERLALSADALAHIWYYTWEKGKSPNLSSYFNLNYTLNHDPVLPSYLFQKR